ncbi:hypothetical protein F5883DRAFT_699 [Diaporthe sp. PMI_573]|nr:hypothetical protein F5883DRAFT_699 [Diaporthaceae sp. PMI_573]
MFIDEPFHDLYFARAELTKRMHKQSSRMIRKLVDFINDYFKDTDAGLDNLRPKGVITHRLLWTLFPPGTLVYQCLPTLLRGLAYEQCYVVRSTSYRDKGQENMLYISAKEWCFTGFGYHRLMVEYPVHEFQGEKTISAETLHHLPFALLSEDLQNEIKQRLIERAKRYLELFSRPASVWEYEGPVLLSQAGDITSVLSDSFKSRLSDELLPGNWMVKERVAVGSRLMAQYYGDFKKDASVTALDLSMPIDEESYLTVSGHVLALLLDTNREASFLLLSHLRPARWAPDALHGAEVAQKDTMLHQVRTFSPRDQLSQAIVGERRPSAGLVFWLKGPLVKNKSFARNIAESTEKPFVQKDLLRFLGSTWEDGPVLSLLTSLKPTLD